MTACAAAAAAAVAVVVAVAAGCTAGDHMGADCSAAAIDERAAAAIAAACGRRIELEAARDEYSEVYLEPSGSHTLVTWAAPRVARHPEEAEAPIDARQQRASDTVAQTVAPQWVQAGSVMRFPISAIAGKQILSATITGRVDHTWTCGANQPTCFYRSAPIAATPRQAWPAPTLQRLLGRTNVHANEASCSEPNTPFEVSTDALLNDLQTSANARDGSYYIAISGEHTDGPNETRTGRFARYFLNEFSLQITYDPKPNTPGCCLSDCGGSTAVPGQSQ